MKEGKLEKWTAASGRSYILAIGIDAYQHCGQLVNAVSDAQAFVNLMVDKYRFEKEQVITIFNEHATREGIATAFRSLIKKVRPDVDNVVVYFSGHGYYDQELDEGYWVPVEAKYQAEVDYISYSYIIKIIKALPTRHTLFIVDSCYSGAMTVQGRNLNQERFEKDPSRWMLASGRNEVVPDGEAGRQSPFAEQLLDTLNRNSDTGLRVSELVNKVTTAVTYNSPQTPIGRPIYGVGDKGGEFVFHPRKKVIADQVSTMRAETSTTSSTAGSQTGSTIISNQYVNPLQPQTKKQKNKKLLYLALIIVGIATISIFLAWEFGLFSSTEYVDDNSIAILPFENWSDDPSHAYFADGLHEDLLYHLSKVASLRVISKNSVMRFRFDSRPGKEMAKEIREGNIYDEGKPATLLNVKNILKGSVQRDGDQVRININLIDAATNELIWSEKYDREISTDHIFHTQTEITREIASKLKAKIKPEEEVALNVIPTSDLRAYNLYLKARQQSDLRTVASLDSASRLLRQSIQQDSNFAQAYIHYGDVCLLLVSRTQRNADSLFSVAENQLSHGMQINPNLAEALTLGGIIQVEKYKDLKTAEKLFEQARDINPNYVMTHVWHALGISKLGNNPKRALEIHKNAVRLNPLSPIIIANLAGLYGLAGEYRKSIQTFKKVRLIESNFPPAYGNLSDMYSNLGILDSAVIYAYLDTKERPGTQVSIKYLTALRHLGMKKKLETEMVKLYDSQFRITNENLRKEIDISIKLFNLEYGMWPDYFYDAQDAHTNFKESYDEESSWNPHASKWDDPSWVGFSYPALEFKLYYYTREYAKAITTYENHFKILSNGPVEHVGLQSMELFMMYLTCLSELDESKGKFKKYANDSKSLFQNDLLTFKNNWSNPVPYHQGQKVGMIELYNSVLTGLMPIPMADQLSSHLAGSYIADWWRVELDPAFDKFRKSKYEYNSVMNDVNNRVERYQINFTKFFNDKKRG